MKEKALFALAGAAALAACSPAEKAPTQENNPQEEVLKQVGSSDTYEVAEPDAMPQQLEDDVTVTSREGGAEDAIVPEAAPQYTPEQEAKILSGTTGEDDGMTTEEIDKLKSPQQ